jgi:hypothetical protein
MMVLVAAGALMLSACATRPPYDYSAFRDSKPTTLLVLPPLNNTPEVSASIGVLAHATAPLAEAGYYVLPVGMVSDTFRENGLDTPHDIHAVPAAKLREIFGADAAVYITVTDYGTKFLVLGSDTRVTVAGRIVDLRNGTVIWQGAATASSQENNSNNPGGLAGLLVKAVVSQIINTSTDASYRFAGIASQRLLGAPVVNGVLYGPRSPEYGK